ncbi:hypothetical protein [Bradyrhizobium sp. B117]|uniref:hypothetical protein n=1 Tax=Bradyrhizobium sp. B117 TaxID=3140246 RepID=UPI003182FB26
MEAEQYFAITSVRETTVSTWCGNEYEPVPDGLLKVADRLGVDFSKIEDAVGAAMKLVFNREYDRAALIPHITRGVTSLYSDEEYKKWHGPQKADLCRGWGNTLVELGVLRKK